ncbi:EamA family transporter, partial [Candidatus Omnitrophota bacterium]
GQICFYHALKSAEASRIVPIAGSFPLVAFILGVLFLSETVTPLKLGGVLLVTLGIWALRIG